MFPFNYIVLSSLSVRKKELWGFKIDDPSDQSVLDQRDYSPIYWDKKGELFEARCLEEKHLENICFDCTSSAESGVEKKRERLRDRKEGGNRPAFSQTAQKVSRLTARRAAISTQTLTIKWYVGRKRNKSKVPVRHV